MSTKTTATLVVLFTLITFTCSSTAKTSTSYVVNLTANSFDEFLSTHSYAMLAFYAPWCYWSHRLMPGYEAAAAILSNSSCGDPKVGVARVDCTVESRLCRKYKVQGYPTMTLFINGAEQFHYYGERHGKAIATWVKKKIAFDVDLRTLITIEEAKSAVQANSTAVFGFFYSLEGPENDELAAASKLHPDVDFHQTDCSCVARLFLTDPTSQRPALVMSGGKTDKRTRVHFDGEFTASAIADFVSLHKPSLVATASEENLGNTIEKPANIVIENPMNMAARIMKMFRILLNIIKMI